MKELQDILAIIDEDKELLKDNDYLIVCQSMKHVHELLNNYKDLLLNVHLATIEIMTIILPKLKKETEVKIFKQMFQNLNKPYDQSKSLMEWLN